MFFRLTAKPVHLNAIEAALIQLLTELMATAIPQHGHRVQYFILSNPTASRVASLAYMKQKPLKHGESCYTAPSSMTAC